MRWNGPQSDTEGGAHGAAGGIFSKHDRPLGAHGQIKHGAQATSGILIGFTQQEIENAVVGAGVGGDVVGGFVIAVGEDGFKNKDGCGDLHQQLFEQRLAADFPDGDMELIVGGNIGCLIATSGSGFEFAQVVGDDVEFFAGGALAGAGEGDGFEYGTELDALVEFLFREGGDEKTAIGVGAYEVLAFELHEGLANGAAADAEPESKFGFPERRAGRILTGHDGGANAVSDNTTEIVTGANGELLNRATRQGGCLLFS